MLIKLDIKNAFDQVKLPFLYEVLLSFGFFPEFVNLIKVCIEKPWIAPLVNGGPTYFFKATRGLRQGFSMSPFLYILMGKSLGCKLIVEKEARYLLGIKSVRVVDLIKHDFFTDDSLFLGRASMNISWSFHVILNKFCHISVALINKTKSVVCGWNVEFLVIL